MRTTEKPEARLQHIMGHSWMANFQHTVELFDVPLCFNSIAHEAHS